jgi:hypothetical protein
MHSRNAGYGVSVCLPKGSAGSTQGGDTPTESGGAPPGGPRPPPVSEAASLSTPNPARRLGGGAVFRTFFYALAPRGRRETRYLSFPPFSLSHRSHEWAEAGPRRERRQESPRILPLCRRTMLLREGGCQRVCRAQIGRSGLGTLPPGAQNDATASSQPEHRTGDLYGYLPACSPTRICAPLFATRRR